ncbi:nuclear transport factor 2 family protein [Neotabrizicola sp. sgz301269]|uniref:nuclear transport factor 2 family protein n=1 Tax=Neotabrizicola sp. sgz301269 TaxID=3276282 RepID=UPI00376F9C78
MTRVRNTREEIILGLEKDYWEAMKRKDGKRSAELSGATSLVTNSHGVSAIAKEKMGAMTEDSSWTLEDYSLDDVQIALPAPDVAIIAYRARQTVTMGGKTRSFEAADCSTWVLGAAGWECHAHSEVVLGKT